MPDPEITDQTLVCAECATEADPEARGWRAYLDSEDNVVTFCPECAEREFINAEWSATLGESGGP